MCVYQRPHSCSDTHRCAHLLGRAGQALCRFELILQGARPPRPSREAGCLLEPADDVWNLISSCWHQDASARPLMVSVRERLKRTLLDRESTLVASEQDGRHGRSSYTFFKLFAYPGLGPARTRADISAKSKHKTVTDLSDDQKILLRLPHRVCAIILSSWSASI
jgi:hypothetical protein